MARVAKKIINHDRGGTFLICAWDTCDKDAFEIYGVRQHEHSREIDCDSAYAQHVQFRFCSERHKQYWLACTGPQARETAARNRGRIMGNLPAGYKLSIM